MLISRHLVGEKDGVFCAIGRERPVLRCYANSSAHLLGKVAA